MVTPEAKNAKTGTAKPGGDGPHPVLEPLGQPVRVGPAVAAPHRDREREQHARHRGVHARMRAPAPTRRPRAGRSTYAVLTRRWTSTAKAAIGSTASAR